MHDVGKFRKFLFFMDFEESILVHGSQPYCSVGLQVGPAFFAFSRPPFAARLRAAEPLSAGASIRCATYLKLQTTLAKVR
jgi:hypothetical protein